MSEKVLFRLVLIGFIVFVFGAILEMLRMPELLKGGYITQMERVIMEGQHWRQLLQDKSGQIDDHETRLNKLEGDFQDFLLGLELEKERKLFEESRTKDLEGATTQ